MGLAMALCGCTSMPRIVILNDPLTAQEHQRLGMIYESQGKWTAAAAEYSAAIEKDPASAASLAGLGNVYVRQEKFREAEKAYLRALKYEPGHPMANNNLASIYILRGEGLDDADRLIQRALESDPGHRAFYLDTRANLLLKKGQIEPALQASREAEAAPGSDHPAFREAHAETLRLLEEARAAAAAPAGVRP